MEKISFDKVLFKSAFAVMACDGEIHKDEISTFKDMAKSNPYFINLDFETELEVAIKKLKSQGLSYVNNFFDILKSYILKEKQKLLLIEVILKIIDADRKVDDNELKFLSTVTNILKLSDEFLVVKFPTRLNCFLNLSKYGTNLDFKKGIQNIKGIENLN